MRRLSRTWLGTAFFDTNPEIGDREQRETHEGPPQHPGGVLKLPERSDDFWLINPSAGTATGSFPTYHAADKQRMYGEFVAARIIQE